MLGGLLHLAHRLSGRGKAGRRATKREKNITGEHGHGERKRTREAPGRAAKTFCKNNVNSGPVFSEGELTKRLPLPLNMKS